MRHFHFISVFLLLYALSSCRRSEPADPQTAIIERLSAFIEQEMEAKAIPALSIALVDDQATVWSAGFGYEDAEGQRPATDRTVYRVGSVSKLFTDIGIMQLVEQGVLDLDAPVTDYLPDFRPENPFGKAITLRQLMAHRAGLVREPPVGHYFDDTAPSLEATIASLNTTRLVYPPETRTKYSNAGIAVAGYILEATQGQPFAEYLKKAVLEPMGMSGAAFAPDATIRSRLAEAEMWGYDGRTFGAPTFELGMAPAGSMYASVLDLAQFMQVLFRGGQGPNGPVLADTTLAQMWTPQYGSDYGIGFRLADFQGTRMAGHGGAIYGFATQLSLLPGEKLGVIVTGAKDGANTVMSRIAAYALDLLLAQKRGARLPDAAVTRPVDPKLAKRLDGAYTSEGQTLELEERNGELQLWHGGFRRPVRQARDRLITDGLLRYGEEVKVASDGAILFSGQRFVKQERTLPPPPPERYAGLIGEYGQDHNVLFILEKEGQLHALIEWFFLYPLTEVYADTYAFPDYGLYHGEAIEFFRDEAGRGMVARAAGIDFGRRTAGMVDGETFTIEPVKPMEALLADALAATPPQETDKLQPVLVELIDLDTQFHLDIRYATTNNFMQAVFYQQARAFLQRPAAEALVRVQQALREKGYGLLIHDAYRPWYVTKMFWDATPGDMKHFVANPASGSVHNRGAAVDLTLYELASGNPVLTVSGYDEFSPRAYPDYPGGTSRQRWYRETLRDAMEAEGFTVYAWEWWHFNYRDARNYPILNLRFEELD